MLAMQLQAGGGWRSAAAVRGVRLSEQAARRPACYVGRLACAAETAPAGEETMLLARDGGVKRRQKVSMMSLGCPKNVVDGESHLSALCRESCKPPRCAVATACCYPPGF